jgi:hypothetical protein
MIGVGACYELDLIDAIPTQHIIAYVLMLRGFANDPLNDPDL